MGDYIVDLYYNKNYTFRKIQKITKKSPRDIKAILDKADPKRSFRAKAISSQAYKLLSEGKSLTEVAIALDIREPEVAQYYKEFWKLNQLYDFNQIHEDLEGNIQYFADLCKAAKSANLSVHKVINLLRIADEDLQLQIQQQQYK